METKTKRPVLYEEDTRRPVEEFSRKQACLGNPIAYSIRMYGDRSDWIVFRNDYYLTCVGDRIFWKKTQTQCLSYKKNKLSGDINSFKTLLIDVFKLDWIKTNRCANIILADRKDMWVPVLSGKITNPEKLLKYFSKKYFKGEYSYNTLKQYCEARGRACSLWDLYYYTVNPEESLKALTNYPSHDTTIFDLIHCAKILNEKVDPRWSPRRMREEHQKQIERLDAEEAESFSNIPIAKTFQEGGLSLILDERTCFLEGNTMHNCVHSCYWNRILKGDYLIARGHINGEYVDLGINVDSHKNISLDQVHTIRNGMPAAETEALCYLWISNNWEQLVSRIHQIKNSKENYSLSECLEQIELPF